MSQLDAVLPLQAIYDERCRQIANEGMTIAHDDEHTQGELATASACYVISQPAFYVGEKGGLVTWPWELASWKPTPDDRVRELVKAGALLVAEIERLQRGAV